MAGGEECGVAVIGSEEACLLVFATICRKVCESEICLSLLCISLNCVYFCLCIYIISFY